MRARRTEAFERVVEEHGAMVLRVCRAIVGPDLAEDAWSETFLAALRAFPSLPPDANVEAWLVTIAHRKAIDQVRSRARRATPTDTLPDTVATPERGDKIDADLLAAITRLPDKQRHCVAYHYIVGLPYQDIAEIIGGNPTAARRAAADGIDALRRTYAPLLRPDKHQRTRAWNLM
jgi:RNA polymerase sigma factor (sigma-70 family)